jgi:hypothetical protein
VPPGPSAGGYNPPAPPPPPPGPPVGAYDPGRTTAPSPWGAPGGPNLDKPTGGPPPLGGYGPRPGPAGAADSPTPWQTPEPTARYASPPGNPGYPPAGPGYAPPGPPPYGAAPSYQQPPPAPAKSGNGCLKAFLIVLGISVVLSIVGVIGLFVVARGIVSSTFGTARPEDFELVADDMTCTLEGSRMEVSGSIENTTDHNQEFRISIEFVEGSSGPKLGEASAFSGSLRPGQSGTFRASAPIASQPSGLTCKVVDVSYFGS